MDVGLTLFEPLVAFELVQVALQDVALGLLQLKVELPPFVIVVGLALKLTVGLGGFTVTFALFMVLPPEPLQVIEYVVVEDGETGLEPLIAVEEVQLALQLEALLLLQDKVEDWPLIIVVGLALSEALGAGGGGGGGGGGSTFTKMLPSREVEGSA